LSGFRRRRGVRDDDDHHVDRVFFLGGLLGACIYFSSFFFVLARTYSMVQLYVYFSWSYHTESVEECVGVICSISLLLGH